MVAASCLLRKVPRGHVRIWLPPRAVQHRKVILIEIVLSQVKPIEQETAAIRKTPYLIILYARVGEDRRARASVDNMEKHRDQQESQGKEGTVEKSLYCRV